MMEMDYNQISDLVLQRALPVYAVDEETKQIVFTNKVLDDIVGSSLTGENCYKAFFGDENLSQITPAPRAPGESYQWDYADRTTNKLYKIQNVWFDNCGRLCRMGIITDTSDLMKLNRSIADYLWLMQGLSALQLRMAQEHTNALSPLVKFFREHYSAGRVAVAFQEHGTPRTFMADTEGVHDLPFGFTSDATPYEFSINGHSFSLYMEDLPTGNTWEEDKEFVLSVAKLHIENCMLWQRLEWENSHDRLTGLLSRSSLEGFKEEYKSAKQLGVIFMDIDELKRTNDYLGHDMGDRLIKKMADILKALLSDQIQAFRMGGDEFLLVYRECSPEELKELVFTILRMAAESNRGEQKPNLSVSCGKAFGRQPLALDALMRTADKHMYDAKRKKKQHRRKAGKPERS